jgi:hypothetical protein
MTRRQYIAVRSRPRFVTRRQHSLAKQASWLKTEATAGSLLKAQNGYAPLTNCASYHFFTAADRILYDRHRAKGAYPCSRFGRERDAFGTWAIDGSEGLSQIPNGLEAMKPLRRGAYIVLSHAPSPGRALPPKSPRDQSSSAGTGP